jgi:hypothetical protein
VWAEVGIRERNAPLQPADTRMSELPTSLIPNFRDVAQRMGAGLNAQPRSESVLEWDRNLPGVPILNREEQSDYVAEQSVRSRLVLEKTALPEYAVGGPPFEGWHLLTEEELSDSKEDRKSAPQIKQAPSHGDAGRSDLESVQYKALADSGHPGPDVLLNRLLHQSTRHHFVEPQLEAEERSEIQVSRRLGSAYSEGTALVQEMVQTGEWKDHLIAGALSERVALLQKVQPSNEAEHVGNSREKNRGTDGSNGMDGRERTDRTDRNDGTDGTSRAGRAGRTDSGISRASKEPSAEVCYESGDPKPTWQVLPLKAQPSPLSEMVEVDPLGKRELHDAFYEYIRTAFHETSTRLMGKQPSGDERQGSASEHEVGESFGPVEAADSRDPAHVPAEPMSLEVEIIKREVERVKKALIFEDASRDREDPPEMFRSSSESDNEFEDDDPELPGLWPEVRTGSRDVSTEWAYPPSVRQMERNQQLTKAFLESSVPIPEAPEPLQKEAGNEPLQNEGRNGHLRQEGKEKTGGRLDTTEQHRTGD